MIDQCDIEIISGKGGNGAVSGRRSRHVPSGGPDGGNGGDGGNVIFVCSDGINTLLPFRYKKRIAARGGGNGGGSLKHGRNGEDIEIDLPVGTEVRVRGGDTDLLADLTAAGERVVVARGGRGGRGNASFKSATNRFPLLAEEGEGGIRLDLTVELKLLADVGIVGAPNAGKSTLLSAVSAARPRVAEYPFTTTEPVLGVVERSNWSMVIVDIPGMIEGAHAGVGLGLDSLRHVERAAILLHLLDGKEEGAVEQYQSMRKELELFNTDLLRKREVVAVNKVDLPGVAARCEQVRGELEHTGVPVHCISAATRAGVDPLLDDMARILAEVRESDTASRGPGEKREIPVLRPGSAGPQEVVRREGRGYAVMLPAAVRVAAMVDGRNWDARMQIYQHLGKLGVVSALEGAGIMPGDVFRVGKLEWTWE